MQRQSTVERFWSKVLCIMATGCWEWQAARDRAGYGAFNPSHHEQWRASRFAWTVTYGPIPDGLWTLHKCDNPPCVRPDHLFLGEVMANARDRTEKNRSATRDRNGQHIHPDKTARGDRHGSHTHPEAWARGERQGSAKLTEAQVTAIRDRYTAGNITQTELAVAYGILQATVSGIVLRKSWRHC